MVSLEKCRNILKKYGCTYTDEEILKIRDFLYSMAAIEHKAYIKKKDDEKGNHLHTGII